MKLIVIFMKVSKVQFSEKIDLIKTVISNQYRNSFPKGERLEDIDITEGKGANCDFVIAYDKVPAIPNAVINMQFFVQNVGIELKLHLKDYGFEGKGKFIPISEIKSKSTLDNASFVEKDGMPTKNHKDEAGDEFEKLSLQYVAEQPRMSFNRIVLADDVMEEIEEALAIMIYRDKLFNEWGLKSIMSPSVLFNLYGESGTGKTMAAEAIADKLGKKIIHATYADIESKWHGEGPQKLKAIFLAAQRQDAVLFIDEADSMLSSRLSNVSSGSEQAINSMRSQLLISLENFNGIVIFATNMIKNYDSAFLTRLICVEIKRPDAKAREKIWHNHLFHVEGSAVALNIPSAGDWNLKELAERFDFCGRDIRNAVKKACLSAVRNGKDYVAQEDLLHAAESIEKNLQNVLQATNQNSIDYEKKKLIADAINNKLNENNVDLE